MQRGRADGADGADWADGSVDRDGFAAVPDVTVTSIVAVVDSKDCRNVGFWVIGLWVIRSGVIGFGVIRSWMVWSVRSWSVGLVSVCQKWSWAKVGFAEKRSANGSGSERFSEERCGLGETGVQEIRREGQTTGTGQRSVVSKRSGLSERSFN